MSLKKYLSILHRICHLVGNHSVSIPKELAYKLNVSEKQMYIYFKGLLLGFEEQNISSIWVSSPYSI